MSLIAHWATKTEEYEEALQALLDCDERLAEYAEAVAGLRDAARAATTQGAVVLDDAARARIADALTGPIGAYRGSPSDALTDADIIIAAALRGQ
jgi:hypothetical protein